MDFQSNSYFPGDVSELWIAEIALNWLPEIGIICSSQRNLIIQGLYTYLWGVPLRMFLASHVQNCCINLAWEFSLHYWSIGTVVPICLSFVTLGSGGKKSAQWVNSDINFSLQRMHNFYGIWPVLSVCTVSLFCKLNTRNANYGFGFHLKPRNGRNVVFGSRCSSDPISYSPQLAPKHCLSIHL